MSPHSTEAISTVLMVSSAVLNNLHSTEVIPIQYWSYPPVALMLSPDVLNNLQCTEQPPQYWTDVIWGDMATRPISFEKIRFLGKGGRGSQRREVSGEKIDLWIFPNLKLFFGVKGYRKWSNEHQGRLSFFQFFSHRLLERETYYKMFKVRKLGLYLLHLQIGKKSLVLAD